MAKLEPVPLEIEPPGFFEGSADKAKKANNISGIWVEPGKGPRWRGFVVSDEGVTIQAFSLETRNDRPVCVPGESQVTEAKGDLEAVAELDGEVYATGSWGNDRKTGAQQAGNWSVLRLRPDHDGRFTVTATAQREELMAFFRVAAPKLVWSMGLALQCGGLNIEGLTGLNGKLYFGLRSPSQREAGVAYVIATDRRSIFPEPGGGPRVAPPKVLSLKFRDSKRRPVKGIGIRALDTLDNRIVISTADAGVPFDDVKGDAASFLRLFDDAESRGGYLNPDRGIKRQLWLWDPETNRPQCLGQLAKAYDRQKVEGLCVLRSSKNSADLLLAIDNPTDNLSPLAILRDVVLP